MKCKVEDCTSKARAKGYCHKHYTRWRKHGDPLTTNTHLRGFASMEPEKQLAIQQRGGRNSPSNFKHLDHRLVVEYGSLGGSRRKYESS